MIVFNGVIFYFLDNKRWIFYFLLKVKVIGEFFRSRVLLDYL